MQPSRYRMEPKEATHPSDYQIIDEVRGRVRPLGWVKDAEDAQRIVNLLNADAERLERQGARVA